MENDWRALLRNPRRAESEDAARALGSADRGVKAGVNNIDAAEMRVAFVPVPGVKTGTEK